jgi:hypothetical protein
MDVQKAIESLQCAEMNCKQNLRGVYSDVVRLQIQDALKELGGHLVTPSVEEETKANNPALR